MQGLLLIRNPRNLRRALSWFHTSSRDVKTRCSNLHTGISAWSAGIPWSNNPQLLEALFGARVVGKTTSRGPKQPQTQTHISISDPRSDTKKPQCTHKRIDTAPVPGWEGVCEVVTEVNLSKSLSPRCVIQTPINPKLYAPQVPKP